MVMEYCVEYLCTDSISEKNNITKPDALSDFPWAGEQSGRYSEIFFGCHMGEVRPALVDE
jgi:hypothetical protein